MPRLITYETEYDEGRYIVSSELRARSLQDAQWVAHARGLGERVLGRLEVRIPPSRPVDEVVADPKASFPEKIHALCWLARLSCASGVASPEDFFRDVDGVIHSLTHRELGLVQDGAMERLLAKVRRIQRAIPGYSR